MAAVSLKISKNSLCCKARIFFQRTLTEKEGRFCTVDLLIKVACSVNKKNNVCIGSPDQQYFASSWYTRQGTDDYKGRMMVDLFTGTSTESLVTEFQVT